MEGVAAQWREWPHKEGSTVTLPLQHSPFSPKVCTSPCFSRPVSSDFPDPMLSMTAFWLIYRHAFRRFSDWMNLRDGLSSVEAPGECGPSPGGDSGYSPVEHCSPKDQLSVGEEGVVELQKNPNKLGISVHFLLVS